MRLISILLYMIVSLSVPLTNAAAQGVPEDSITVTTTSREILGDEMATGYGNVVDPDEEIKWSVYVPANYNPENPPGILIYQFYGSEVRDPTGWKSAMDEKNMILIRLIQANEITQHKELLLSILAPTMVDQRYSIDPSRIYTSAFDGCRNAGALAKIYPNIIKGAIYINCVPTTWRKQEPELVHLMRENRYYFIAARDRVEQVDVRPALKKYDRAGIKNVEFVRTGRLSRGRNLNRTMLIDAIDYLDGKESE